MSSRSYRNSYFDAMPCYLTVQDRDLRLIDANQSVPRMTSVKSEGTVLLPGLQAPLRSAARSARSSEVLPRRRAATRSEELVKTRWTGRMSRTPDDRGHRHPIRNRDRQHHSRDGDVDRRHRVEEHWNANYVSSEEYATTCLFDEVPCYITTQDPDLNIVEANFARSRRTSATGLAASAIEAYKHRTEPCVHRARSNRGFRRW